VLEEGNASAFDGLGSFGDMWSVMEYLMRVISNHAISYNVTLITIHFLLILFAYKRIYEH
jgi:hypothetical protein